MKLAVNRWLLLLALGFAITACSTGQTVVGPSGPNEKVPADSANALQITDIALPAGSKLDADDSLIIGSADRWFGRLVLKTESPTVQTYNHFYGVMPTFGWSLISAVQAKSSILSYQRGDRIALIQIESASLGGTVVAINITMRQPQQPQQLQSDAPPRRK